MAHPSKAKGDGFEREVVKAFSEAGVPAQKVPLSGARGGRFGGDVQAEVCGTWQPLECKIRKRAWSDLYGWLSGTNVQDKPYALVIRTNAQPGQGAPEPLVVMPLSTFILHCKGIL
jgi:hypothetical protein